MRPRDVVLSAAVAATWGVCFVVLSALASAGAPLALAAARLLLGGGVLVVAALRRGGIRRLRAPGASWRLVVLLAALNGGVGIGAMFLTAGRADAAVASVLGNAQPVLLAIAASLLFAERVSRRTAMGIALGTVGVAIVAFASRAGGASLDGLALALVSSAAPAAGTILMRRLVGRADLLVVTAWQFLGGGVALLGLSALAEAPVSIRLDGPALVALLFLGIVGTGISYIAWFGLLERVPLAPLGSALYLVPVVGLASDALVGGRVSTADALGLAVMLIGVVVAADPVLPRVNWRRTRRQPDEMWPMEPSTAVGPVADPAGAAVRG